MLDRWEDEIEENEVGPIQDILIQVASEAGLGAMFATLTHALDGVREQLVEMAEHDDAVRQMREGGAGELPAQLSKAVATQQYAISRLKALVTALVTETDRVMKQEGV